MYHSEKMCFSVLLTKMDSPGTIMNVEHDHFDEAKPYLFLE